MATTATTTPSTPATNKTETCATTDQLTKDMDAALSGLEEAADDVRVRLHLANMDAKDYWNTKLEPQIEDARRHAREATAASAAAIDDIVKAFRTFAHSL